MTYNNIDVIDVFETGLLMFTAFCTIVILNMFTVFN